MNFILDPIVACIILPFVILYLSIYISGRYLNNWSGVHFKAEYDAAYIKFVFVLLSLLYFIFINRFTSVHNEFLLIIIGAGIVSTIIDVVKNS